MSDSQTQIDALMAEVAALASEAVDEIAGSAADGPREPAAAAIQAGAATPSDAGGSRRGASPGVTLPAGERRSTAAGAGNSNLTRVLHIEVPVIVRLAERSMPLAEILNLTSGSIIEFDKPADAELDLLINNKCIGHGQAVKVSENFGLRLTRIGSLQERIKAMGR